MNSPLKTESTREPATHRRSQKSFVSNLHLINTFCKVSGRADRLTVLLRSMAVNQPPCIFIISGTIISATMLIIFMSGLMAGPAVSL